jgi:hypothetical protein
VNNTAIIAPTARAITTQSKARCRSGSELAAATYSLDIASMIIDDSGVTLRQATRGCATVTADYGVSVAMAPGAIMKGECFGAVLATVQTTVSPTDGVAVSPPTH